MNILERALIFLRFLRSLRERFFFHFYQRQTRHDQQAAQLSHPIAIAHLSHRDCLRPQNKT